MMSARLKRRFGDNPPAFAVGAGATVLGGFVVALCTDAETAIVAQSMVLAPIFIAEHFLDRRSPKDRDHETNKAGEEQRHAHDVSHHAERQGITDKSAVFSGRPCTMEQYVAALRAEGLSANLVYASIGDWLKGDFEAAMRPLDDHTRARLTGKGGDA